MATFSVTELGNFRRCRRKWNWTAKSRMNLTGVGAGPEPLELGSLVHRSLADWMVAPDPNELHLPTNFLVHASNRKLEIAEAFKAKTGMDIVDSDYEALTNVVMLGFHMMENYQEHHKTPLPSHIRFAAPEQEIIVPVPGTERHCIFCNGTGKLIEVAFAQKCWNCSGTGVAYHYLSGTLDGLAQDEKDRFLVVENKTYENRPTPISLSMNDQFTGYCWLVRELKIGQVAGVAYNGLWKRDKPPKYMQKERRAGVMADLFIRTILPKSNDELDEWGRNLILTVNEMGSDPSIYPNIPWQGCADCNMQEPCLMMLKGEDPTNLIKLKYTQREEIVRGGR